MFNSDYSKAATSVDNTTKPNRTNSDLRQETMTWIYDSGTSKLSAKRRKKRLFQRPGLGYKIVDPRSHKYRPLGRTKEAKSSINQKKVFR